MDFVSKFTSNPNADVDPTRSDRVDQCRVIWYQWTNLIPTDSVTEFQPTILNNENTLNDSNSYDISDYIENFSYNKSMGNGAGSFTLTLANAIPWNKYMRAGTWIMVYLSPDGNLLTGTPASNQNAVSKFLNAFNPGAISQAYNFITSTEASPTPVKTPDFLGPGPDANFHKTNAKYRRVIGVIQRVAQRTNVTPEGALDVHYVVTGKDFGIAFEETDLWFNLLNFQSNTWEAVARGTKLANKNLTTLMNLYFDVFFNTDSVVPLKQLLTLEQFKSFSSKGQQWILPRAMTKDLGVNATYIGQIPNIKEFYPTLFECNEPNPIASVQGPAWAKLKEFSEPTFHELFTELSETGMPKIIFRPMPWSMNNQNYPSFSQFIMKYIDLVQGTGASSFNPLDPSSVEANLVQSAVKELTNISGISSIQDKRTVNSIKLKNVNIMDTDLGPSFHERYNFFLVDYSTSTAKKTSALATIQKNQINLPFPFQNDRDIKRHGFKPLIAEVKAYITQPASSQLLSNASKAVFGSTGNNNSDANINFVIEATEVLRDYHQNAEDFYSGTMTMAGDPTVRLGLAATTDDSFPGLGSMIFYIQGYSDNFVINTNKVGTWTQTLELIRGVERGALDTSKVGNILKFTQSTKDSTNQTVHFGSFHLDDKK